MVEALSVAVLLGLAGSLHCIGMCGGFAVMAGAHGSAARRTQLLLGSWVVGKSLTYGILGALLGVLGGAIPSQFAGFQSVFAIVAALLLIIAGVHLAGFGPSWSFVAPAPGSRFVARMSAAVRSGSMGGRFVLGLLNGLLPCGLVYAALAYSLTYQSASVGGLFMVAFGLGTAPALIVAGTWARRLSPAFRSRATRLMGWLLIVVGIVTIFRVPALMELLPFMSGAHAH